MLLVVVWIIFFNMLNLHLIAQPLVNMMTTITGAIPYLLKAALILLLAWVAAYLLRLLFRKGAALLQLDTRLVKWKMAENQVEAHDSVERIAQGIFYFILLLFLPGVLGAMHIEGISGPFSHALTSILAFIPKLFAAGLILFIGWLVAKLVRDILTNFLKA